MSPLHWAGALKIIPSRDGAQSNSCSLLDGERLMQLGFSSSLTLHTSHILSPISQDVSMVCPLYTKLNHVTFFLPIEHVNLTGNVVIISVCSNQFTICLFAICLWVNMTYRVNLKTRVLQTCFPCQGFKTPRETWSRQHVLVLRDTAFLLSL